MKLYCLTKKGKTVSNTTLCHMLKIIPYFSPHLAKVSHSLSVGMSKRFPMTGSPLGPGGNGALRLFRRKTLNTKARPASIIAMSRVAREVHILQGGWLTMCKVAARAYKCAAQSKNFPSVVFRSCTRKQIDDAKYERSCSGDVERYSIAAVVRLRVLLGLSLWLV